VARVWFCYEDDLARFVDLYREVVATRAYENAIERGNLVQLIVRPLSLFLADDYRVKLHQFGSAMQSYMAANGVMVRGVEMIPSNGYMDHYLVRMLTIMRFSESLLSSDYTIVVHPTVWFGLRLC